MIINKEKIVDFFKQSILLAVGSFICAIAVNAIMIPNNFVSSGFTGISLILYYIFPSIPVGASYLLINIPAFFLGWRFIGLRFVLYTLWGILLFSVMLCFVNFKIDINDRLLAAIIAGCITGIGVGIMLSSRGSSGGSEILCIIMYKIFSITIGTGVLIFNVAVMAVALFFLPVENIMYTIVFIIVSAKVTDSVRHGLSAREAIFVISERWEEILEELTKDLKIGVTVISSRGGYEGKKNKILYSVINRKNVYLLKKIVMDKDPAAFISIMESSDVTGLNIGNQPKW
ncbi:MAG: hypothetical protein BWY64_03423 [bacterium ADurb.Bin363]|nr:MAG: hypothetical protein BWY64_03423 [bacterium ADurb.Bin363]